LDCQGGWVTSCVTGGTGGDDGSGGDDGTGTGGGTTTTDPDPSPEDGDIAVLPLTPTYINNIITCLNGISLIEESPENNFVYEDFSGLTEAQLAEMHGYLLRISGCSEEAKEFVIAARDALMDGGDVDFENLLIYSPIVAQDYKSRMSESELYIFDTLTTLQKEGYLRAATQAYIYAESHFPRPVRNTKGYAFKHSYWNALSTVYIGEFLTQQLTNAHEVIDYDTNYPNHFKETEMDLFNNSRGRELAYGAGRNTQSYTLTKKYVVLRISQLNN
jgi:hypothetical protein